MLKIEVTNDVKRRKTASGEFVDQVAHVHLPGDKYPQKIIVPVPRGAEPYPEGVYTLASESFFLAVEYGQPKLAFRPVLHALVKPATVPASAAKAG